MHDIPAQQLRNSDSVLHEVFRLAPTFMAVLRGPAHIFEFANEAYYRIVGHRELHHQGHLHRHLDRQSDPRDQRDPHRHMQPGETNSALLHLTSPPGSVGDERD